MAFEEIKAGLEAYTAGVEAKLAKTPERANLAPNRLYTPIDLGENFDYCEKLGFPGEYPFTRGVQPTVYRGRSGPYVCMLASPLLKNPTNVIVTCWLTAVAACPAHLTFRPKSVMTPPTLWLKAKLVK